MKHLNIDANDPLALRLRDRFLPGRGISSIPLQPRMKLGQCYANVVDWIRENEGSMQLGWLLSVRPSEYVEATHHAVWKNKTGQLIDITEHAFEGMEGDHSTFIPDDSVAAPTDYWHPNVPSWFLLLTDDPSTKAYVRAVREETKSRELWMKVSREQGLKVERLPDQNIGIAARVQRGHPVIEPFEKVQRAAAEKLRLESIIARRPLRPSC